MTIFKVGDKVKTKAENGYYCVKEGDTGTVVDVSLDSGCDVAPDTADWDGCATLYFYDTELEKVDVNLPEAEPVQTREEILEAAVTLAQQVFVEYMNQHLAKGDTGRFKAQTNFGFATVMEQALAYKAD